MALSDTLKNIFDNAFGTDVAYRLEVDASTPDRITGILTSSKFIGLREYERQDIIWDILDENLTDDERACITIIIANTPDETSALLAERRHSNARN